MVGKKRVKVETSFNFKLFDRVVAHFRKYPGNLAMNVGVNTGKKERVFSESLPSLRGDKEIRYLNFKTHCGTVGCLAGWTDIIGSKGRSLVKKAKAIGKKEWEDVKDSAIEKLRIPEEIETATLFYASKWPEPFLSRYRNAENNREKVRAALARFKAFREEMVEHEKHNPLEPVSWSTQGSGRLQTSTPNEC